MSSYLDNGKSIILDCVLTDTARFRLASGDVAKLKITKFALADDEINYGRYQKNHASGSAWRDLEILQTPVLEAFTNNASSMKYKLISVIENNLMYMPQLLLNEKGQVSHGPTAGRNTQTFLNANSNNITHTTSPAVKGIYMVTADLATEDKLGNKNFGILFGVGNGKCLIRIDQGINTETVNELSPFPKLSQRFPDLYESAYTIQMPHHLVHLVDYNGNARTPSFIDDDQIALYTVGTTVTVSAGVSIAGGTFVRENDCEADGSQVGDCAANEVHKGPRGSILEFLLHTTQDVQSSTYFFERYGGTFSGLKTPGGVSGTYYYIDHNIKITGLNTGVSIDVPIRIIKYKEDA